MEELIGTLAVTVFAVTVLYFVGLVWWKIFSKAGFHGALGLLMFVPLVNLVMICVLAFREWPIQHKLDHVRRLLPPERHSFLDAG